MKSFVLLFFLVSLMAVSCTKKETAINLPPISPEQLIEHGQKVFQLNCVACHGADPQKDGSVGPAVAGSSLELIEARVMRAQYPKDYHPKRSTALMVALPHLQNDLVALHAYLNSVK